MTDATGTTVEEDRESDGDDPIARARAAVATERRLLAAERDAFERFRSRVAGVEATPPAAAQTTTHGVVATGGPDPALSTVRRAYERTVMAVPHYDREYGDGVAESLSAEFGADVAVALTRGRSFGPRLRESVVGGAAEAREERCRLLDVLADERESLAAAATALDEVDRRIDRLTDRRLDRHDFEDLRRLHGRLARVDDDLDAAAADRQATLSTHAHTTGEHCPPLPEYLYGGEPFAYPVLAGVGRRGETVADARRRVRRALTDRV